MKLIKISSAFLASCIFETIIALEYFDCQGVTFTLDYVNRAAYQALEMQMYSHHDFPIPYNDNGMSRGREGYRQFPLLTSGEIWNGEQFDYYLLTSPELDTLDVFSTANGNVACDVVNG
ncbi:CSEP0340 putative effector protein [Blumeria hordei DH14]|uniref:CSEP0340 putative effector protein n=1 Tax=Blumeria graminis f. sp. hordei (strain DH14) TaxID=546991 RepID=N1J6Z6_BLUG1|nr:CSEP0340 putative effector protein [Blumeria hordei DH14]